MGFSQVRVLARGFKSQSGFSLGSSPSMWVQVPLRVARFQKDPPGTGNSGFVWGKKLNEGPEV